MTTQNSPIEDGHDDATDEARLDGLTTQVQADYRLGTSTDAAAMLQTRLDDAGIVLSPDAFAAQVAKVTAE
jgi:hypothetical protein